MNNRQPWQRPGIPFLQDTANPRHYEAWEEGSAREIRLSFRYGKGRCFTVPYGIIIFVEFIPPATVSLMTVHYLITLTGRNLQELNELLQDEKVRSIQVYDEHRFDLPDDSAPVVQSVKIDWLKPKPGAEEP